MWENIAQLNKEGIKGQLKKLVRGGIEKTFNELGGRRGGETHTGCRYERNERRQGYRNGHYNRNLTTTFGEVTLKALKPREILLKTPSLNG